MEQNEHSVKIDGYCNEPSTSSNEGKLIDDSGERAENVIRCPGGDDDSGLKSIWQESQEEDENQFMMWFWVLFEINHDWETHYQADGAECPL